MANDGRLGYSRRVMQRPPQMPSILSTRQAYQWINRIAQKHQQFSTLKRSAEQVKALNQWVEVEFIKALVAIEDANDTTLALNRESQSDHSTTANALRAFRLLKEHIATHTSKAPLNVQLLLRLNGADETRGFRLQTITGSTVRPENLPIIVENVCRWFASTSIEELNPVEQGAIALLRLVEIAPFERGNEGTALVAASLFTMRQGLPPIIVRPENQKAYLAALDEGLQMNTQPMVELVARSIEQSLDEMLNLLKSGG
jgi:Fic family protein